jgi:hypothetical protein
MIQPYTLLFTELRQAALHWQVECDAVQKVAGVRRLEQAWAVLCAGLPEF